MKSAACENSPATVYLEILYGCNLYCSYCYVGRELNHEKPNVPPLDTTKSILMVLKKAGVTAR
jgi:MoaA/NifB/PqqE/SkfB family radical SAM enzyme